MRSPTRRASSAISAACRGVDRCLAVGQREEVDGLGFEQRFALGQEAAGVCGLLVGIERSPVAVQLVEDPLPWLAVHLMAGIDEGAGLAGPDARRRVGYERVELCLGSRAHREPHYECERLGVVRHLIVFVVAGCVSQWPGVSRRSSLPAYREPPSDY